ncbi:thioredoxin family protein [Membranihabitans marinus]|uniref:thioredoxin family protein n=1 Tax=Membranihabitans marinus TaxID=1227546 RepID=UPI001F1C1122|nr:thioredoxin domain-containing protein [Membranihabitans marinus]
MTIIDPENFESEVILKSYTQPVVLDFWAPWCRPCLQLIDNIDQIKDKWKNEFHFCKLNVDQHTDLALDWKIRGVPNVKIWTNGYVLSEFSTALTKAALNQYLHTIKEEIHLLNIYKTTTKSLSLPNTPHIETVIDPDNISTDNLLHLCRWYLVHDTVQAIHYMDLMSNENELYDAYLYLKDLLEMVQMPYSDQIVGRKVWAAKNAFQKKDYKATYQFLLQGHQTANTTQKQQLTNYIIALGQFLGDQHQVLSIYKVQIDKIFLQ